MVFEVENAKLFQRKFNTDAWAEHHGIVPELLDLKYRYINPVTACEAIQEEIGDARDTSQFLLVSDVRDRTPDLERLAGPMISNLKPLLLINGTWVPPNGGRSRHTSFLNPSYIHLENLQSQFYITDTETRREIIDTVLRHGILSQKIVATMFGIKKGSLRQYLWRRNINWQSRRKTAQRRLIRTLETLSSWGYEKKRLGEAFNIPYPTIISLSTELDADWTPPKRPTNPDANIAPFDQRENPSPATHIQQSGAAD